MTKRGMMLALLLVIAPLQAADIRQRTSIVCVSGESKSLLSTPDRQQGRSRKEELQSSFTQWMLDAEKEPRPSTIRFLWIPYTSSSPPELRIATNDSVHSTVRLLSQTRHDLLVATSASSGDRNSGWMFAINFKAERVIATSVLSTFGGARGRAFNYECRFNKQIPKVEPPSSGSGIG